MTKIDYSKAEIFVVAHDKGIRQSLKSVLFSKGFRKIQFADTLDLIIDAINLKDMPNLLITDVDLPNQDCCELISAIRNKRLSIDPYLPIIGMAWNPNKKLVSKIVNSGFDIFVAKPFSANQISERIDKIVFGRQPFIVTGDYFGPDRYKDPSRPSKVPEFDIPNSLKSAAVDGLSKAEFWQEVGQMHNKIYQQRLNQLAVDIDRIVGLVTPDLETKQINEETVKNLDRLLELLKLIRFNIIRNEHKDVAELCVPFYRTVDGMLKADGSIVAGEILKLRTMSDEVTAGLYSEVGEDSPYAKEQNAPTINSA
ncbi:MAG: response regulator [Rhodospirillaceae bacterium]|nr:response regulator [Rhodospirillaceae bacterium]MBT5939577.1 response regulator [Rhodospirillaceae bacterium]MBT7267701.1 response regulator [Rhodospirillaceae bacterium]